MGGYQSTRFKMALNVYNVVRTLEDFVDNLLQFKALDFPRFDRRGVLESISHVYINALNSRLVHVIQVIKITQLVGDVK